jgi:methionyl-tRNA formyltransferase
MRVVFFGSPEFALPTLRRLIDSEHEIVGVYTQPDRPTGRGRKLAPPPVKTLALDHNLPVFQPPRISARDSVAQLRSLAPDVGVLAAYGQILKQPVLDVPPLGILNVHASLLPRWRGAAPIPAAILAGDPETGATIMKIVLALDAGPVLGAVRVPITDADTTATLTPKIAEAGAGLLMQLLPRYAAGELTPVDQDDALATYAPQLEKDDGRIDWATETAAQIARKVRAYNPWPMAWTTLDNHPLRILEAIPVPGNHGPAPGTIIARSPDDDSRIGFGIIAAEHTALGVVAVQSPGRAAMSAHAFARGRRELVGNRLT